MLFSNVVDFDERITMIGDSGRAYLGGDDVRAVDVTTWTPFWTSTNLSLEPVVALTNGGVAMHDLSSGVLHEMDANGSTVSSGAFGGRWGYQTASGMWTGVTSTGLTARFSLAVNETPTSFTHLGQVGSGQQRPRDRFSADTRERAALDALDWIFTEPLASGAAKFEYRRPNLQGWSTVQMVGDSN